MVISVTSTISVEFHLCAWNVTRAVQFLCRCSSFTINLFIMFAVITADISECWQFQWKRPVAGQHSPNLNPVNNDALEPCWRCNHSEIYCRTETYRGWLGRICHRIRSARLSEALQWLKPCGCQQQTLYFVTLFCFASSHSSWGLPCAVPCAVYCCMHVIMC